jgi:D-alanyl-D-alanine endopeptidase (penicillin-binding protein 7)
MRLPATLALASALLVSLFVGRTPAVAVEAPVLRAITPWAPPEWHPNAQALQALPGFDGSSDRRIAGVSARAAFAYDLDSGEVLFERRADDPYPIASLTKLVSSLAMASEHPDLDAKFCIDDRFRPTRNGAKSKLSTGECYTGWDLVGAALVASDNRGAYGLQVISGLDYDDFIQRMDDVAADLGMTNSSFADPSGLEDDNLSTARDVARAVIAVSAHPDLQIAATATHWRISPMNAKKGPAFRVLNTTDHLADNKDLDILAAKTGYSGTAGYCFATVARTSSGRTLVISLLGSGRPQERWTDVKKIVDALK